MADILTWTDAIERLGLALGAGFLVGVERGWKQRNDPEGDRVAGLRTFALSGLLGGLSGLSLPLVGPIVVAAIALSFCAVLGLFEYRRSEADHDNSVTSTIAGILVFVIGLYCVVGDPGVGAAAAVATTLILAFKQALHAWLQSLTWSEIRSALLILAATFIALPLLPSGSIDPWGAIEPRSLWLIVILVAAVGFVGYVALRVLGARAGLVAGAVIGATVSSTAVTLDLARRVRTHDADPGLASAAAALATTVSLARVAILASVFSTQLAFEMLPALGAAAVIFLANGLVLFRRKTREPEPSGYSKLRSPLDLASVARFAAALGLVSVAANLLSRLFGAGGVTALAATAGLADVDAATLSVGKLVQGGLQIENAATAILLAVVTNQLTKVLAAVLAGSLAFAARFGSVVALSAVAGTAAQLLVPR